MSLSLKLNLLLLLASSFSSFGKDGAEIIEYQTKVLVKENKVSEQVLIRIKVSNKESNWIGNVSIYYDEDEKIELLNASILDKSGKEVRNIKKKEVSTRNASASGTFHQDRLVSTFSLTWHEYPYFIEYAYERTKSSFIHIVDWTPYRYNIPIGHAGLTVEYDADLHMNIYADTPFVHTSDTIESTIQSKWEIHDLKPIDQEIYSPNVYDVFPWVVVVPNEFKFGEKGSLATWESFGIWLSNVNLGLDLLTPKEALRIKQLFDGSETPIEKIKILYKYLQSNTRYVNISIDEGNLIPYPASYVCENKYGDCKALTIYMKALLNEVGIQSYYTLVYAGSNPTSLNANFPSLQFNHVILAIPIEKDTIYLENTSGSLPFNYLGTFTQNRKAFLVNGAQSQLINLKPISLSDAKESSIYHFSVDPNGEGTLTISKRMKGPSFEQYNEINHGLTEKEQLKEITERIPIKNFEVQKFELDKSTLDTAQIDLAVDLSIKDQFRKIGKTIVIDPTLHNFPSFSPPEQRVLPVKINYPINWIDSINYHLPFMEDYKIKVPDEVNLTTPYGTYHSKTIFSNGSILAVRSFQLFDNSYSLAEYPDFFDFFTKIKSAISQDMIILNPI